MYLSKSVETNSLRCYQTVVGILLTQRTSELISLTMIPSMSSVMVVWRIMKALSRLIDFGLISDIFSIHLSKHTSS